MSCLRTLLTVACLLSANLLLAADFDVPAGLKKLRVPKDNPLTAEKVALGKQLYWDGRLSSDNKVSCASCHHPDHGWSNGERFATGVKDQVGGRNSPTVLNTAYQRFQFWDGRAGSLEEQALGPIQNPIEMNMSLPEVVKKLNAIDGYREQFQKVFGTDVTSDGIAKAIAAYERTILSGDAPYDRFKAGDEDALGESAQRGMKLFFGKARCSACHSGSNFTDNAFHNIGVGFQPNGKEAADAGRKAISNLGGDYGSFKTPTLREIARTAPYMHDGSEKTLEDVVKYYNRGGNVNAWIDEEMAPLGLTEQEIADLVTFVKEGLSSDSYPNHEPPELPGLVSETSAAAESVLAPGAKAEKLGDSFKFTEGPTWDRKGTVYFSDIPNSVIHTWTAEKGIGEFTDPVGASNGLRFDADGQLLACQPAGRALVQFDPRNPNSLIVLADTYGGKKLNSPNDLWIDPTGGVYFTDPRYGSMDDLQQDGFHVYYLPKTKTGYGELVRVLDNLTKPNGVVGTADGKRLYVADPGAKTTYVYDITGPGKLANRKVAARTGSDGLAVDTRGNLYVTGQGISVYSPEAELLETIPFPERPANMVIGGPDGKTLYVTARKGFYSVKLTVGDGSDPFAK